MLSGVEARLSERYTAAKASPPGAVPKLAGVRVLIVDDEADTRELFKSILEQHTIEVVAVSSVAEALHVLNRWRPDVLVSDLGMPRENGYDLIRQLRRLTPDAGGVSRRWR